MNLKCFFREEILLAPHTLNDHIPPSFLEALPDDISPYWCPAKDFKAQLEDAIQLLSPRRNSDAFNQEKEYLVSVCSRNFKFEDDDVNCINTKATYSFNEYIMDFRSMNLLIFNSNAKRDIVLVSEKYIQCCVTSHLEGFHALYESFFKTIAFEKEVGLPYFKIGPMLSENFRRHVALLDLVDIYSLERLWNRLYILVCVAPNITPGQTASPGVIFEPIVKDIVFECYKVYFFTFLEDLLTVLCKSIFEEYCETSDPSACSEFIKHRVSRYMTIFRDPANLQSKYSTNVSCELTELVGRLDDLIVHNTLQRAEHICSTLYSHPFIQVKLPINLLPEIVYNFRDVLVKDIKDLDVSEESPVGIHLNLINDGLLAFGTNVPQSDRPTMPSNSRAVMRQFLKGERKKQNAANKEASRRNSSLISTSKDTKKSKHPPRKLKAVNREVSNIIQKALPIDAPDSHDKQVIGNYDSILSYIDQILDLPSSNLPPSLDHLKRKEQATAFIQDMNKYFELL